jgi:hypothetical protein
LNENDYKTGIEIDVNAVIFMQRAKKFCHSERQSREEPAVASAKSRAGFSPSLGEGEE